MTTDNERRLQDEIDALREAVELRDRRIEELERGMAFMRIGMENMRRMQDMVPAGSTTAAPPQPPSA